ncbi:Patterned expression site protein 10 [Caenorhabditis elegans]|uniref:Patterned expression site protein 10 n=1 Tax=Caenorhabditis elegans TaxID=6239 RepID=PES10_CAEEL|nr:Patterned expression site protein 10 [Caenorhabditis elegans]P41991.1 RecName: Full=Patterned expression site protein 10 [Caenorhabditis elegans]AAA50369.1 PES-10 [Caenorhabditis elegans]CAB60370.1 Patterned expression site protein 10 [Caenorhabditis elegans]|eukprot:NP_496732.1 Patterned expression site protein 10 [Caenorhabditis elegans]
MNKNEYMMHLLARTIRTRNDDMITPLITQLADMQVSMDILEKHNFPALVAEYAPFNKAAQSLSHSVLVWKNDELAQEKSYMLKEFVRICKDQHQPEEFLLRLTCSLINLNDFELTRSCFDIIVSFGLTLNAYDEFGIFRKAMEYQGQMEEADKIISDVDAMLLRNEFLEEDEAEEQADNEMDAFEEEGVEEVDQEVVDFNDNESVISETESGVFTDEELDMEDHAEVMRRHAQDQALVSEICMVFLAGCIKSGRSDVISAAIQFTGAFFYPLALLRKYDIQYLIYCYGSHNEDAELLMNHIKHLQAIEIAGERQEFFKMFMETTFRNAETVTDSVMAQMKGFLEDGDDFMISCTLHVFLKMPITLSQFKNSHVEACLENLESGLAAQLGFMLKMKIQLLEQIDYEIW